MSTGAAMPVVVGVPHASKRQRVRKVGGNSGGKVECGKAVASGGGGGGPSAAMAELVVLPHKQRKLGLGSAPTARDNNETKTKTKTSEGGEVCVHCDQFVAEGHRADHTKYDHKRVPQFLCAELQAQVTRGTHCGECFKPEAGEAGLDMDGFSAIEGCVRLFEVDEWSKEFEFPRYLCLDCANKRGYWQCRFEYVDDEDANAAGVFFGCGTVSKRVYSDSDRDLSDVIDVMVIPHCTAHYRLCCDCPTADCDSEREGKICEACSQWVCDTDWPEHSHFCADQCDHPSHK